MQRLMALFLFALLLFLYACGSDDGAVYPSAVTEFVDAHVDNEGVVDYFVTDAQKKLYPTHTVAATTLTPDSLYRTIAMYAPQADDASQIVVYSVKLIFADLPLAPDAAELDSIGTDPLYMQSLWRGGNYLNIVALPMAQNIAHRYAFALDSIRAQGDSRCLHLALRHDQNADVAAYKQKAYLSVPLGGYNLQSGDSIFFTANLYDEGQKTWRIAY